VDPAIAMNRSVRIAIIAVPFSGTPLLDRIVMVSAVDNGGKPAPFTQIDAKAFWAPGVDLPAPDEKGFSRWSGTGPASRSRPE
jgi:hypothetical protein